MKKLIDIIEALKANEKPDYEELRYAMEGDLTDQWDFDSAYKCNNF